MDRHQFEQKLEEIRRTEAIREVLKLLLAGHTYDEISELRGTQKSTVRKQISNIYKKFGIQGRYESDRSPRREDLVSLFKRFEGTEKFGWLQTSNDEIASKEGFPASQEQESQDFNMEIAKEESDIGVGEINKIIERFYFCCKNQEHFKAFNLIFGFEEEHNSCIYRFLSLQGSLNSIIELYEHLVADWEPEEEEIRAYLIALTCLGDAYEHSGQPEEAINCYQALLKIALNTEEYDITYGALVNLGLSYASKRQFKDSIDYSRRGLEAARQFGFDEIEACALNNLGISYQGLEEYDLAIDYYHHSIAVKRRLGAYEDEAGSLINLGNVCREIGKYSQAVDFLLQGINLAHDSGFRQFEANGWYDLALALEEDDNEAEAIFAAESALELFESMELVDQVEDARSLIQKLQKM